MFEFLSTAALRNEHLIRVLVEEFKYDLQCFHFMKEFCNSRKLQIHGCFLLRMCVEKDEICESRLLSLGLLDHIKKIEKMDSQINVACVQLRRFLKSVPFGS